MGNKLLEILRSYSIKNANFKRIIRVINGPQIVCNINLKSKDQKKVLLCYLPQCFEPITNHLSHPNILHCLSMVNVLTSKGFAVDVCYSNDLYALKNLAIADYDFILGFGKVFDSISQDETKALKILLVTENDPNVVKEKYKERIQYFKERHPSWPIKNFIVRDSFYNAKKFYESEVAIVMNSSYNINNFKNSFSRTYPINVNGLYNEKFSVVDKKEMLDTKKFLWFGSSGALHKGLDIIIDAFSYLPELVLSVYGANPKELRSIKKIPQNVHIMGKVSVFSDEFLKIANENAFVLSASCSEGMNSGIATCMLHGIVPIITKETGFDKNNTIIELDDFKVESVVEVLKSASQLERFVIEENIENTYKYAHDNFTLEKFEQNFERIVDTILN